jgi:hypothetical protein
MGGGGELNPFQRLLLAGKSLYKGRGSTTCADVDPLKELLLVQRKFFVLFLKQTSQ